MPWCINDAYLRPFFSEKRCKKPTKPEHGKVNYKGQPGYPVGSKVTYECEKEYELEGSESAECAKNETWSPDTPTCSLPQCQGELLTHSCPPFQHLLSERLTSLGIMGTPEVPPLCREMSVSLTANVGTVGINGLKSCVTDPHQGFARKISAIPSGNLSGRPIKVSFLLRRKWSSRNGVCCCFRNSLTLYYELAFILHCSVSCTRNII